MKNKNFTLLVSKWTEGLPILERLEAQNNYFSYSQLPNSIDEITSKILKLQDHSNPCVIAKVLRSKEDLSEIAIINHTLKKNKILHCKIAIVDYVKRDNVVTMLQKMGITEILDPSINEKSLKFKIDRWQKTIAITTTATTTEAKRTEVNRTSSPITLNNTNALTLHFTPSEEKEDDIWFLKNNFDAKKALGQWMVKLEGPSGAVAKWHETVYEGRKGFRLELKDPWREKLMPNEGKWFFLGDNEPDWNWRDLSWIFTGKEIKLEYDCNGIRGEKFALGQIHAFFQENSQVATKKLEVIYKTCDPDLVVNNKAEELKNLTGEGQTDKIIHKNLNGKINNTNQKDSSPLNHSASNQKITTHWTQHNTYQSHNQNNKKRIKS